MTNNVCKNKSIHINNEIKYYTVRGSQDTMRIVKKNNQYIKTSGIYNNDKITGVEVNKMSMPQETSYITK